MAGRSRAKISLITTVYNEENAILPFLDSAKNQTVKASEIIIVDAGSKDSTIDLIKRFVSVNKRLNIRLFVKKGNRSMGRNFAIKNAKNNIIAVSDVGCFLDRNWLNELNNSFKKDVDVVAGYYKPVVNNTFEKSLASYTCVMPDKVDSKEFLPSSRSIAFKKNVWRKVKGYPEELNTCEDLVFAKKLKSAGFKFIFVKDAIVYWPQRKNLISAFLQFFRYALGDGKARYFRKNTPLLYGRYLIGFYLLVWAVIFRSPIFIVFLIFLVVIYLLLSIRKNYKYVQDNRGYYFLPVLQILSDFAIILGTTIGFFQSIKLSKIIKENRSTIVVLIIYSVIILTGINWGIPGNAHPFNYNMDEWHQMQAVRSLFKNGTPNVPGAANAAAFQFFLSGIYLIPFIIFKIVNPFIIKNGIDMVIQQTRIFQLLRINTLLFGIGSVAIFVKIIKDNFKVSPFYSVISFVVTPIWLILSIYFKYDIALIFWILLSLYLIFRYIDSPSIRNYLYAGISCGLASATKISALPILGIYFLSPFITKNNLKLLGKFKYILIGFGLYLITLIAFGYPDIWFNTNAFKTFYENVITNPSTSSIFMLNMDPTLFLFVRSFPAVFGHLFFYFYIVSIIFWIQIFVRAGFSGTLKIYKKEFLIFLSLIFFILSLWKLNIFGSDNRSLTVLPFFAILSGLFINRIISSKYKKVKVFTIVLFVLIVLIQSFEIYSWEITKINSPYYTASDWINKNIKKGTLIGLENIPIYQTLPNFVLKDFYSHVYGKKNIKYNYEIISNSKKIRASFVIITNRDWEKIALKKSTKEDLVDSLENMGYEKIVIFNSNTKYLNIFNDDLTLYFNQLLPLPSMEIFKKQ